MHTRAAIGSAAGLMNLPDLLHQLLLTFPAFAAGPMTPGVVAAAGDFQHITHDSHGILLLVIADEREPQFDCFAK